jgi:hypothetical protein
MVSNSKRSFKAVAVACAVLLTCATAQTFTSSVLQNNSTIAYAVSNPTAEVNADGCLVVHIDTTSNTSGTVTLKLTGGKSGYGVSGEVGYWDSTASKWVGGYYTWTGSEKIYADKDYNSYGNTFDSSGTLTISGIKVPTGVSDVQVMVTYYADWSTGKEILGTMSSLTAAIDGVTATTGTTSSGSDSTGNTDNTGSTGSDSTTTYPMKDGASCGWEDITSGTTNSNSTNLVSSSVSGETKTVTVNQGGQWYADESNGVEPIILDQTWKPEVAGQYDTDRGNYDSAGNLNITNSNNFMLSDDLGIPTNATINLFRFTFESDEPMYQVQFGAGISVEKDSEVANSGAKDADGNITSKIWFNESGTYDPANESDYSDIKNENGKSYYGLNTLDTYTSEGTNYIQAQWNMYDDVRQYIKNDPWSSVSVQYWYGVNKNAVEDWSNVDLEPQQVTITEAIANYDVTETYNYTDTATESVNLTLNINGDDSGDKMQGVKFSDLGLTENDQPQAVTIKVKGASDLGKLIGAFGVSVSDDCPTDDLESANWYQSDNIVYEDCGDEYTITWVIPSSIAKYVNPAYDAEVKFGAWYAGSGETSLDSLTIESISVDYYTTPEVTTAPVVTTTEKVTTAPTIVDGIKGDLVDLNMGPIDPADDDKDSPTFHQFTIEPITKILPDGYNGTTSDIAQIVFNISSDTEMKDIAAACGISVSQDCPDATSNFWYQGDDFKVSGTGKNVTITWTVPESIREYVQDNDYGNLKLGIWYAGEGVDEVYLDSAYVVYTTSAEETTTTPVTTTAVTTTTTTTTTTPVTTTAVTTTKATTTTTAVTTTAPVEETRVWGDVNVDGSVSAVDVLMLKKYLLQMIDEEDIPDGGLLNADVTHDGEVTAPDLVLIKKYILQMIDSLA